MLPGGDNLKGDVPASWGQTLRDDEGFFVANFTKGQAAVLRLGLFQVGIRLAHHLALVAVDVKTIRSPLPKLGDVRLNQAGHKAGCKAGAA